MDNYVVATIKSWNIDNFYRLTKKHPDKKFFLLNKKEDLTYDKIKALNPKFIFFPHWSWIIPENIYKEFNCVVFHMTDLPFGRGGSPLQNLIVRGIYKTKISAIKVVKEIDAGPIYLKEDFDISKGNADSIYTEASNIIFDKMIPNFLECNIEAHEQEGEVIQFPRRTSEQSKLPENLNFQQLYDYIRMLDGEGYPNAYIELGDFKVSFKDAEIENDIISANVIITRRL